MTQSEAALALMARSCWLIAFETNGNLMLHDAETATRVFRITQKVVTNAGKHGNPNSIQIFCGEANRVVELKVIDDRIGLSGLSESDEGIGLQSMRYRSNLIRCKLSLESNETGGTTVSCILESF